MPAPAVLSQPDAPARDPGPSLARRAARRRATALVRAPRPRHNVRSPSPEWRSTNDVRGVTMRISADLCALALRGLVGGACKALGCEAGAAAAENVVGFLMRHFSDHSQRLLEALRHANDRAWRALEVALAGDGLWDRCKLVLASGDEKA